MAKKKNKVDVERRNYFRIDDVMPVIVNPAGGDECRQVAKVLSVSEIPHISNLSNEALEGIINQRLCNMLTEIRAKLDFLINHFILEKEGLLTAEKKMVNISASGIRFTIDKSVKVGEIMEIKLLLPTYPPVAVLAYGEVKRVKPLNEKTYEIALQYINMGEEVREEIIRYTLSHQRETRSIEDKGRT
jgi:c-di-GMP-binding flagellar brake protein YcgR